MSIVIDMHGSMHPALPDGIEKTYRKLYKTASTNYELKELSCFFPLAGNRYCDSVQISEEGLNKAIKTKSFSDKEFEKYSEPAKRLMIVGRCPNGWINRDFKNVDEFLSIALSKMDDGASWLRDDGKATETYIRKSDGKECRYNINRSAFFRSIRNVLHKLIPVTNIDPRWFDYFLWTNLYCFSPADGGNANEKMKSLQLEDCKELLIRQIEHYRPTHIVFITDWDYWFDAFSDLFPKVEKCGNSFTDNVVGKGKYNSSKVVVSIRPDRTKPNKPDETKFANDIIAAFDSI